MMEGKRVLVTGATGSLGKVLIRRLLSGAAGRPAKIIAFSRDEGKQHAMRIEYLHKRAATDDITYHNFRDLLEFHIGDVRDLHSLVAAMAQVDVVFNAAALKQVPICEYFPFEAVRTNVGGPENIVRAIRDFRLPVTTVVGVSTDKAVEPINVMGMTKALQERVFARANLDCPGTRFVLVRYGNVLASRGSVVPLFHDQIRSGGPVTITDPRMTRFLLSLEDAVDVILAALSDAAPGETYVPRIPSACIADIAAALIDGRDIPVTVTGIRPGEKMHESLVSDEEGQRTFARDARHWVIAPLLPELRSAPPQGPCLGRAYTSAEGLMTPDAVRALLHRHRLMVDTNLEIEGEVLR
jgi:UDP-glucose 4-epimerase